MIFPPIQMNLCPNSILTFIILVFIFPTQYETLCLLNAQNYKEEDSKELDSNDWDCGEEDFEGDKFYNPCEWNTAFNCVIILHFFLHIYSQILGVLPFFFHVFILGMLDFSFEEMHRLTSLVKRHLLMMFSLFESNLEGYLSLSWISLVCFILKIELYKLLQFNYLWSKMWVNLRFCAPYILLVLFLLMWTDIKYKLFCWGSCIFVKIQKHFLRKFLYILVTFTKFFNGNISYHEHLHEIQIQGYSKPSFDRFHQPLIYE